MVTTFYSNKSSPELKQLSEIKRGGWVHVVNPDEAELAYLEKDLGLDIDLLRDGIDLYESPRIEREDAKIYVFTRYCYPEGTVIATEPLLVISTPDNIITILRTESTILHNLIEEKHPVITTQRTNLFLQILTAINSSYERHIHHTSRRILTFRSELRRSEIRNEAFVDFIDIQEDFNEFLSALQGQALMLRGLVTGRYLKLYEDDKDLIEDLLLSTDELIDLAKTRLKTILSTREAYSNIMANNLNRTFRTLTSIGIFMTIPTITAGLYGMNITLPLANHPQAFWIIVGGVLTVTSAVVLIFRKAKWL